jgi:hypothetical protein
MRTFADDRGRNWALEVNGFTLERVEAACGVYLPALFDDGGKPLAGFLEDDRKVIAAAWELGRDRAEKDGLTLDDLKKSWGGEVADRATEAFIEGLIDFFRDPKRRGALRKLVAKWREVGGVVLDKAGRGLDAVTGEQMDAAAEEVIAGLRLRASANGSSVPSGNSAAS